MKKVLFLIAAAALLFASCTQEKLENPAAGQEVNVTFKAQLPENIATKTYSDGSLATVLTYAVYDSNSKTPLFSDDDVTVTNGVASIDLTLITGKTYDLLFWAQSPDNTTYAVDLNAQTMTVNYKNMNANDDNNDAFFAFETLTVGGAVNETIELYRPFAQVNLGTNDLASSQDKSFILEKSSMKAKVANVFNFADGTVSGEAEVEYVANAVPAAADGAFPVSGYDTYLSMNYLLVGADQSTTNCEFGVYEEGKTAATNTITVSNVPVKRNYRTNIYGSLLTDPASLKIEVKPAFNEPGYDIPEEDLNGVIPAEEFYQTLQEGGAVYVNEEMKTIDFRNLTIAEDVVLVLNKPVGEVILGGNNVVAMKSATERPNVTIVVAKDVKFPSFNCGYSSHTSVENYTIKADPTSSEMYNGGIQFYTGNNIVIDGIRFGEKGYVNSIVGVNNLTVKNCTAVDGNRTSAFITIAKSEGLTLLNNIVKSTNLNDGNGLTYNQNQDVFVLNNAIKGEVLIKGNTIEGSMNHHGIWIANSPEAVVTVKENTITNAYEDALKIDQAVNVTVADNTFDAGVNAVRFDNFNGTPATLVVTGNTISTKGTPEMGYGIYFKNKGGIATNVNATAKDNIIAEAGIADNKYGNIANTLTLTGDYEYPFPVYAAEGVLLSYDSKTYGILNAEGLRWFAANPTKNMNVKLANDIDLAGQDWTPINGWNGVLNGTTIDGQGYTISNMTVNGGDSAGFISDNASSLTIKNITFDNAYVATAKGSQKYAGVVMGKNYSPVTLEKVNVTNSAVVCTWQCGGLVGFAETHGPVFVDCSISDCFVGGSNATAGTFFGLGGVDITATGCKAANIDLYTDGLTWGSTQKSAGNFLVGHIYGKTLTAADYEESGVNVVSDYPEGIDY